MIRQSQITLEPDDVDRFFAPLLGMIHAVDFRNLGKNLLPAERRLAGRNGEAMKINVGHGCIASP